MSLGELQGLLLPQPLHWSRAPAGPRAPAAAVGKAQHCRDGHSRAAGGQTSARICAFLAALRSISRGFPLPRLSCTLWVMENGLHFKELNIQA